MKAKSFRNASQWKLELCLESCFKFVTEIFLKLLRNFLQGNAIKNKLKNKDLNLFYKIQALQLLLSL